MELWIIHWQKHILPPCWRGRRATLEAAKRTRSSPPLVGWELNPKISHPGRWFLFGPLQQAHLPSYRDHHGACYTASWYHIPKSPLISFNKKHSEKGKKALTKKAPSQWPSIVTSNPKYTVLLRSQFRPLNAVLFIFFTCLCVCTYVVLF